MFLVAEISSLIKIIGSVLAYLIFIPISILDKYFFSRILYEQSSPKTFTLVVVLLFFFVALGLIMRSAALIFKLVAVLLGVYLLSDFIVGLLFFSITLYSIRKIVGMNGLNRYAETFLKKRL